MKLIIIYVFHLTPPLVNGPVRAGAGEGGPILRL